MQHPWEQVDLPEPYRTEGRTGTFNSRVRETRVARDLGLVVSTVPTFERLITLANGAPHTIGLRQIIVGGRNVNQAQAQQLVPVLLQRLVTDAVLSRTRLNADQTAQVNGLVFGTNPMHPDSSRSRRFRSVADITTAMLIEIVEAFMNSQTGVEFEDIEWLVVINPVSLRSGSGLGDNEMSDYIGPIACAAIALVIVLDKESDFTKNSTMAKRLLQKSRALQTKMEWGQNIVYSDLQKFVDKYPQIRLTVLTAVGKSFRHSTFTGSEYTDRAVYIEHDIFKNHFRPVRCANTFMDNQRFCAACIEYFPLLSKHECFPVRPEKKRKIIEFCDLCDSNYLEGHVHSRFECKTCGGKIDLDHSTHRCVVMKEEREDTGFYDGGDFKKDVPDLWVYDIESGFEDIPTKAFQIKSFGVNQDYMYEADVYERGDNNARAHYANLLVAKNVYTDQVFSSSGRDCIREFYTFISNQNKGNVICLAHNAAGYDSRLIYDYVSKNFTTKIDLVCNGSRIMQMKIRPGKKNGNYLIFRDTLCHLTQSLRDLTKAFNDGSVVLAKGYFPHLFNTPNNADYVGPIPPIEKFDLSFSCRSNEDVKEFEEWYNAYTGDWSMKDEIYKYCLNDVECLHMVVKTYSDSMFELYNHHPFKYMTGPSYAHALSLMRITKLYELPEKEDDTYNQKVQEAVRDYWPILKPQEYVMPKKALRGGRTDTRQLIFDLSQDQIDAGEKIAYVDVCSMYPWEQAVKEYPVGLPTIHVVDENYRPCFTHRTSIDFCFECLKNERFSDTTPTSKHGLNIVSGWDQSFEGLGGFVACEIWAPNILHPVLIVYDEKKQKALAPCGLVTGVFTINAIRTALANGYVMHKIFRVDVYKMAPSLWEDFTLELFLGKLCTSESEPGPDRQRELVDFFEENFDAGDMVRKTFGCGKWGFDKVKRLIYKGLLNCGWGKHCQAPIKTEKLYVDFALNEQDVGPLFANVMDGLTEMKSVVPMCDDHFLYSFQDSNRHPNLGGGYLPAGVHVPDYGRLTLWEQMNKCGKRVLYNDTDSIIYHVVPGEYEIPVSEQWGGWEEESISKKGIVSFVGVQPKTYACKMSDGSTLVKCKGLNIKRAHQNIVNFDVMHEMMKKVFITGKQEVVKVPQTSFVYIVGTGIQTRLMLKDFTFSLNSFKGLVDQTGYVYPPGYAGVDFNKHSKI